MGRKNAAAMSLAAATAALNAVRSPPELMRVLKDLHSARRTTSVVKGFDADGIPLAAGADAMQVARGAKPVLSSASNFNFKCTGCGACCRNLSASVLLDPYDVWGIATATRRPTAALLSSSHLVRCDAACTWEREIVVVLLC